MKIDETVPFICKNIGEYLEKILKTNSRSLEI